jgi:hypothetical protein
MPSRWSSLAIVAFWLGTNGLLFYHDIWPTLRPGQPPPMAVDLIQEAKKFDTATRWNVTLNDRPALRAQTSTKRVGPGLFDMVAHYSQVPKQPAPTIGVFRVRRMRSSYRVTTDGDLRALEVEVEGAWLTEGAGKFTLAIRGEVEGGRLTPHLHFESAGKALDKDLPAVEVPARGSVLMPLHPVERIRGLRRGQSWRVPVVDPVADSIKQFFPLSGGPRFLSARVADEAQELRPGVPCLVVHYQGDDLEARTWVEEATGQVLRQEAVIQGGRWVMERE